MRVTMKIPIWIRSEYVTYIGFPSFLSSGGVSPPIKEGRPPFLCSNFPYRHYNIVFAMLQPWTLKRDIVVTIPSSKTLSEISKVFLSELLDTEEIQELNPNFSMEQFLLSRG